MISRRKRAQREEIRLILHTMRLELAAQQLTDEQSARPSPALPVRDIIRWARGGRLKA